MTSGDCSEMRTIQNANSAPIITSSYVKNGKKLISTFLCPLNMALDIPKINSQEGHNIVFILQMIFF